ncbi:Ribonuclease P protein component, mitochondrial [Candida viswanathii]|uniref:Ribonuclease P protein component, mitochondrial n=1 Tax=Candida viswanathii TaxID=5486 RepID=A0A367Y3K8_9ASCO|nr:Ribonuclease P protein component, mitochondrial [Candida viswanathii]
MVFQSFIRFAKFNSSSSTKTEFRLHFFKSSYPYLSKHHFTKFSLSRYNKEFYESKWWFKNQRNTSNRSKSFLSISDGHYGLYYSMYNHDAERRRQQKDHEKYIRHIILKHLENRDRIFGHRQLDPPQTHLHFANCYMAGHHHYHHEHHHHRHYYYRNHHRKSYRGCPGHGFHIKLILIGFTAKFLISKALLDNQISLENIKKFSSKFLASLSFKPSYYFLGSTAAGATVAAGTAVATESQQAPTSQATTFVGLNQTPSPTLASSQPASHVFATVLATRAFSTSTRRPKQQLPKTTEVVVEVPSQKVDTFEKDFLATQISNITSAFNNHACPEDLNIIYPLYQAVKRNNLTLPTIDLYNIVLKSILKRDLNNTSLDLCSIEERLTTLLTVYQDILNSGMKPDKETYNLVVNALLDGSLQCLNLPTHNSLQYAEIYPKSQEFAQICVELFASISNQLDMAVVLPKLLKLLKNYPQLITAKVIGSFISIIQAGQPTKESCLLILELSKYFAEFGISSDQETFTVIESTYHKYKQFPDIDPFAAYEKVITSLINNNFAKRAGQLLNDILDDYKEALQFEHRPTKKQISDVIATFIHTYVTKTNDVVMGYEMLVKFNSVAYLPELPVSLYNFMIIELAKKNMTNEIWALYNRVMVRVDFQKTPSMTLVKEHGMSCRDLLLSLSIDNGDHEHTFQLLKEILVKEHLIADLGTLQKTFHYLYNAVVARQIDDEEYFNQYYFGLLWQLMESQAIHYQSSTDINDFISRFVPFLTVGVPPELQGDVRAQIAITSYNVNLLLSSPFVLRAAETFDVQADNVYGLTVVMAHLMKLDETYGVNLDLYRRVAEFESILIEEFDDPDNFYVELTPEMTEFVQMLKNDRDSRISKIGDVTREVSAETELDLSGLVKLSFDKGVERFIDAYAQGSNFTFSTWNSIIKFEFMQNYIGQFDMQQFLQRMWSTRCTEEKKIALLKRLIEYNVGNVIDEIGVFMSEKKIFEDGLLSRLFSTCLLLKDEINKDLFVQDSFFKDAYAGTPNRSWVDVYLRFLTGVKKYDQIFMVFASLDDDLSTKFGYWLLNADLETDIAKFEIDRERLGLTQTARVTELNFKYDLMTRKAPIGELAQKYSKHETAGTTTMQELISFAHCLQVIQGETPVASAPTQRFKTINLFATSLLSCRDFSEMCKLVQSADRCDSQSLFGEMISVLSASIDYANPNATQLMNKFFDTIKICKHLRMTSVSNENFLRIIRFLTKIKSDLLVVILNRFIMNGEFANIVNFYFMEVQVFNLSSKLEVLKELYHAMKLLKNDFNVSMIDEFCQTNGIKLQQ